MAYVVRDQLIDPDLRMQRPHGFLGEVCAVRPFCFDLGAEFRKGLLYVGEPARGDGI